MPYYKFQIGQYGSTVQKVLYIASYRVWCLGYTHRQPNWNKCLKLPLVRSINSVRREEHQAGWTDNQAFRSSRRKFGLRIKRDDFADFRGQEAAINDTDSEPRWRPRRRIVAIILSTENHVSKNRDDALLSWEPSTFLEVVDITGQGTLSYQLSAVRLRLHSLTQARPNERLTRLTRNTSVKPSLQDYFDPYSQNST